MTLVWKLSIRPGAIPTPESESNDDSDSDSGVGIGVGIISSSSSSSSFFSAGQRFPPHRRTSGGVLEWAVESTTVTHSSADWWGLLLPLA